MEDSKLHLSLKFWAEDDQPREKLLLKGRHALSDAELIAILLRSGNQEETAVDLSRSILKSAQDNLIELSKFQFTDFLSFKGIGEVKALSIIAALELGKRRRTAEVIVKKRILNSKAAFDYFQPMLEDYQYETFWLLLLNRANKILKHTCISEGGVSGTIADPKKIFKICLDMHASGVILCHNHPSGNTKPSEADILLTKKLNKAGKLLDINIIDHIIIGEQKYYSFADNNML